MVAGGEEASPLKAYGGGTRGSTIGDLLCGSSCCKKDQRSEELQMPAAPMAYPKAKADEDVPKVRMNLPTQADIPADTTASDLPKAAMQAEDVDVDGAADTGDRDHHFLESEEEEWFESEEEEEEIPEDSSRGQAAAQQRNRDGDQEEKKVDHRKSIEALKASFDTVNTQLKANPQPTYKQPAARHRKKDESDSEEEHAKPSAEERRREIEDLRASFTPIANRMAPIENETPPPAPRNNQPEARQREAGPDPVLAGAMKRHDSFQCRESAPAGAYRAEQRRSGDGQALGMNHFSSMPSQSAARRASGAERKKKNCTIH